MDYKVLLLMLIIATVVAGQTTQYDSSDQTSALSEQEDPTKVSEQDSSTEATSSTEDEDEEDGDLKSSGTAARYTFTQADARTSLSPAPTNDLVTDDDDDDDDDDDGDEEAVETMADLEKILEDKDSNNDKKADAKAIVPATNDDDDDDDDDEGDDDDDEDNAKPASESIIADPKSSQLRRLGDLQPGLMTDGSDLDSEGKTAEAPVFVTNPEPTDSSGDGSPLLHLTQGGYQRPDRRFFGIYDQRQRMRAGSASQQSETLEAPQAQAPPTPQVMPPYQPQSSRPMFQNPFALPGGIQSGFFNTPPAGFTDFSTANFQSPFHPAGNGPYSAYPRDQNGFSVFQAPQRQQQNQGVFPPNLPYQQQVLDGNSRPVQPFFHHPGGFPGLPNMDIVDDTPRPNYSPYMRPQPAAHQFPPVNPNFYGSVPNADFANAGVMPNLPRQSFQPPMYRYPDNPLTLQSSDQLDKQKQDGGGPEDAKDSDALTASQDKEDPTAVPFGARIKPGNDDSEVYLRYPIQEAGYATEENLPVRNTTEKSRNSDPSNSPFPFFTQPDGFRPFSNPDPYRDAMNALQQGYLGSIDNSNQTREVPADPFSNNSPVQFDERPAMMFPHPYHQREQVFQNRQFLPMDARNPFYQLPGVQDNGVLYPPPPASMRSAEDSKKTPSCAKGTNSTVCFEDADYPRRELIYAMNSDSFLVERLSSPNQVVEEIVLQDQKASGDKEGDNSICKSEIKYGLPLRAKSVKESWKVIVNLEKGDGSRQFIQPVRLEICKGANQPCSFTQVKTTCVQKYSLQRLLSWSPARGMHTDVFRLPIACSCQVVVDAKA